MSQPDIKFNKQLYANSGLKQLFAADQAERGVTPTDDESAKSDPLGLFFNRKEPNLAILHEKPEHRLLLYMKAQGASNREIARTSGYSEAWISQLMRQPWAQERLLQMMNESGLDRIQTLLAGTAEDSIFTLIELRDKAESETVRRGASNDLLDRFLGKPRQQLEVTQREAPSQNIEEIQQEIERLESEQKQLLGTALN